jgi:hypothetical protein
MAATLKCLCCGEPMTVGKTQAKGKPWAACDECGVQVFVRGGKGVKLFEQRYGDAWKAAPPPPPKDEPPNDKDDDNADDFGW